MKTAIQKISDTEYRHTARGAEMTLKHERGQWAMYVVNAVVRAYRRGYAIPKYFDSLEQVEQTYKTWRGITALVAAQHPAAY